MPKWIKIIDKRPALGQTILVEYFSGDYERKKYIGPEDWWVRNVNAWLDESEPSFSIEDMRNSFQEGEGHYLSFTEFMKENYNIDITQ